MTLIRAAAGAAAVVAALVLTACSSSSSGTGSTVSGLPAAGGGSSGAASNASSAPSTSSAGSATLTAAQGQALAKAGDLVAADMPGYDAKTGTNDESDDSDAKVAQCLGVSLPTYVFNDPGTEFDQGDTLEVDSTTDTVSSAADVATDIAAFSGPKAQGCFVQLLTQGLAGEGITSPTLQFKLLPISIKDADGAFGVQITGTVTANSTTAQLNVVELGAGVGQAEVSIDFTDAGLTATAGAPSVAELTALLQKSVDRVVAAYPH